jgi:hypothetical protein
MEIQQTDCFFAEKKKTQTKCPIRILQFIPEKKNQNGANIKTPPYCVIFSHLPSSPHFKHKLASIHSD